MSGSSSRRRRPRRVAALCGIVSVVILAVCVGASFGGPLATFHYVRLRLHPDMLTAAWVRDADPQRLAAASKFAECRSGRESLLRALVGTLSCAGIWDASLERCLKEPGTILFAFDASVPIFCWVCLPDELAEGYIEAPSLENEEQHGLACQLRTLRCLEPLIRRALGERIDLPEFPDRTFSFIAADSSRAREVQAEWSASPGGAADGAFLDGYTNSWRLLIERRC